MSGYTAGARVFSNSWGSTSTSYTYLDTEIDSFMYSYREALILVSAGNAGASGAGTVYSPALSKNALSVGAGENEWDSGNNRSNVAWFSSQGPTWDSRIKPDVVAPGRRLFSASAGSTCAVLSMQGTSMSTPATAAAAAIIRQYFVQGWYPTGARTATNGFRPTGALVKAMLVNSAVPMKTFRYANGTTRRLGLPPDGFQGFGRIKLDDVLPIAGTVNLYVVNNASLAEGNTLTYKFTIPKFWSSALEAFKATMTWTDPDTSSSASKQVLHNLDLSMTSDLTGTTTYANGGTALDSTNTVEKIAIYSPTPGDVYTLSVTGTSIATTATQTFALAVSGTFYSGAWYCQNPQASRTDTSYTTANCQLSCGIYSKNPICCNSGAGAVCSSSEIATSPTTTCETAAKPYDCVSPTPAPSRAPSSSPTRAPTRPTVSPTRIPSSSPTILPTMAPTQPTRSPTIAPTRVRACHWEGDTNAAADSLPISLGLLCPGDATGAHLGPD